MWKRLMLLACLSPLVGCKGAPVQEMSDARQAIAAARAAGAAEHAPVDLNAAQAAIQKAEQDLQLEHYTRARLAALEAKRRASAALANAQNTAAGQH
ncbi:MAG: DUF4398 domain-containing protein [Steroidobacteraceae bacterium]